MGGYMIVLDGTKGETFPTWTTATRPTSPSTSQTGYNTDLGTLEFYNGSSWIQPGSVAKSFAVNSVLN